MKGVEILKICLKVLLVLYKFKLLVFILTFTAPRFRIFNIKTVHQSSIPVLDSL